MVRHGAALESGLDVETRSATKLWLYRGHAPTMKRPHRHDELEVNVVLEGRLEYLFGGSRVAIHAGEVALFWAATPHRLLDGPPVSAGSACWAHIPLDVVVGWGLPDTDLRELLRRDMLIVAAELSRTQLEEKFDRWSDDADIEDMREIVLLEMQALIRRLLKAKGRQSQSQADIALPNTGDAMWKVTSMAQFVVANFRRPISVADVATVVHLNPNYAGTLFSRLVGATLGEYLSRCRVAEAKRLLITTSMTVGEIAHEAGFGSQSSFYTHFSRSTGQSPIAYRTSLR